MTASRSRQGILLAAAYALLGLADMALSSVAFVLGVPETNPVFIWAADHGFFVVAKLALTAAMADLLMWLYRRHPCGRLIAWGAVLAMGVVVAYHGWGLSTLGLLRLLQFG